MKRSIVQKAQKYCAIPYSRMFLAASEFYTFTYEIYFHIFTHVSINSYLIWKLLLSIFITTDGGTVCIVSYLYRIFLEVYFKWIYQIILSKIEYCISVLFTNIHLFESHIILINIFFTLQISRKTLYFIKFAIS